MTSLIVTLNEWGGVFCHHAFWMLIQTGVLVSILWAMDVLLRRHVKASIRYGIWLLVLAKLVLPVDFKLPSGVGYWLHWQTPKNFPMVQTARIDIPQPPVVYENSARPESPAADLTPAVSEKNVPAVSAIEKISSLPVLSTQGWILTIWTVCVVGLFTALLIQFVLIRVMLGRTRAVPVDVIQLLLQCQVAMGINSTIRIRRSKDVSGPAVCGLLRPTILIPSSLIDKLEKEQLETVLLHELIHIQRHDLWVNFIQTILQIFYFYNPFVRLANHCIRRTREQANDEQVLVRLNGRRDHYSATLVEVAAAAVGRPMFAVRLIGVAEPKNQLHERITLMMRKAIPTNAKMGFTGILVLVLLAAVLLPMAAGSRALAQAVSSVPSLTKDQIIEIQQQITERMYTAYNQGNAAALAGEFTDDGISLQNLAEPSMGKVSIQSLYTWLIKGGMKFLSFKPNSREIWTSGKYVFIATQNGVTYQRPDMRQYLTDFINSFSIYEIQPDGSVKIKLDSYGLSSMPTDSVFFKENGKCETIFNPQEENPAAADTKDIETVKNLDLEFHKACDDKKPGSVLASYYADDTVMMTVKQNMIRGKNNLLPLLKIVQTNTPLVSMEQEILSAEGNSQIIFIVNKFTWKVKSTDKPGEVTSLPGKGVHVWKKQADGSWKILIDMVNTDVEI